MRDDTGAAREEGAGLATAADRAAVSAEVRRAGSSFYWAMRLMGAERRAALFGVYAFCRAVDDIADGDLPPADKQAALAAWRRRIAAVGEGAAESPLERLLADAVACYGLQRADFEAVIAGMEMDASGPLVAPDETELDLYCDRVACAVGRLCVRIFGAPEEAGRALACHLGRALQLTNIIRDVEEDAEMGRLYLPAALLERYGVAERAPQRIVASPALPAIRRDLARQAEAAFAGARDALARCETGDLRPAIVMMKVYERLFARMKARDFAPGPEGGLARLRAKAEKLWVAARYGLMGRRWRGSTS